MYMVTTLPGAQRKNNVLQMLEEKPGSAEVSQIWPYLRIYEDFFPGNFYLHMIFTLDVDFKPNPYKILLHCSKTYNIYEKLQKEKNDTLRKI